MKVVQVIEIKISPVYDVRKLRLFLGLTQHELALLAGVSAEEVNCFEHHLPVRLDAKRRILKELWMMKTSKVN